MNDFQTMSSDEQQAVVSICLLAAFADGLQNDAERDQIKRIAEGFSTGNFDLVTACQDVLTGRVSMNAAAGKLQSSNAKALAYEMAVCICSADQHVNDSEKQFLARLKQELNIEEPAGFQASTQALAAEAIPPVIGSVPPMIGGSSTLTSRENSEIVRLIANNATLSGALELMPHSLATMAIVPLQMRMVYRIGKNYGYELDRTHIKDFLATVGIGLTSHAVEGYLAKLVGGVTRRFAGRFVGMLAGQAASSGLAFATTYAIGQVAKTYYSSGRTLTTQQLRDVFSGMLNQGQALQGQHATEILQRSGQLSPSQILPLIRQT